MKQNEGEKRPIIIPMMKAEHKREVSKAYKLIVSLSVKSCRGFQIPSRLTVFLESKSSKMCCYFPSYLLNASHGALPSDPGR